MSINSPSKYKQRQQKLIVSMADNQLDGIAFFPGANLFYTTGLNLHSSERLTFALLTRNGKLFYVVPKLEATQINHDNKDMILTYSDEEGPLEALNKLKNEIALKTVGIDFNSTRVFEQTAILNLTETTVDTSELLAEIRMVKSSDEVSIMKKAVQILEDSLKETLNYIRPGITELEVASFLEYEMKKRGSDGTPFDTIVGSGYRGALPHGRATEKKIQDGELIVIDFGSIYQGYAGDMTRTIGVGHISDDMKHIYDTVKQAIEKAYDFVKPNVEIGQIDLTARNVITEAGFGEYFTHRTGHGIGLDCHEEPYVKKGNSLLLKPGMAFTIEPGIYVEGKCGVRIEDDVFVTETGVENLMSFSKELIILP